MKAYLIFYNYKVMEPAFGYLKIKHITEKGSLLYACDSLDKNAVQEIQQILSARHLSYYITHVRRVSDINFGEVGLDVPLEAYPADTAKVLRLVDELVIGLNELKASDSKKDEGK